MTPSTAKRNVTRARGQEEGEGSEARVESATGKADGRVIIRGSHQRLFCGFDPHWLATNGYFPLVSLRFGGVIHHPRVVLPVVASCLLSRAQNSTPDSLSLSFSLPPSLPPPRPRFAEVAKVFHPDSCLVSFRRFSHM